MVEVELKNDFDSRRKFFDSITISKQKHGNFEFHNLIYILMKFPRINHYEVLDRMQQLER